jgi:hypothetical protein
LPFSMFRFLMLAAFVLMLNIPAIAKVPLAKYNVPYDSAAMHRRALFITDSMLRNHPQLAHKQRVSAIMKVKSYEDRSPDFYLLVSLCIMLGLIRYSDTRYFSNLINALWNPNRTNRQLKGQLQATKLSNLLMNIFFTMSAGAYVYYVIGVFNPQRPDLVSPSVFLALLVAGMMLIYLGKYLMIRFSGWAFRLEGITDFYLFNVFLINKIIAIVVLPFIVLFAFADPVYAQPLAIVSFVLVGILLVNRYTRSWQVFGSFFQYSKFHFFMYLCASELLPLAVLMKLLVQGLLQY